jgi:type III secretion system low calcium response chaperone LcrH/SycD
MKEHDEFNLDGKDDMLLEYFGAGGTLKDLKNMSNDAMESIYSMAYNLYNSEKYDDAQKIFQFLCFYDHFNKKYFLGLASCQCMLKNYDSAIDLFSFAAILDSTDPRAMLYLGDCHLKNNDKEKAKLAYEVCVETGNKSKNYKSYVTKAKNMLKNC